MANVFQFWVSYAWTHQQHNDDADACDRCDMPKLLQVNGRTSDGSFDIFSYWLKLRKTEKQKPQN